MNAPIGDEEFRKYAPRRIRDDLPNREQSPPLSGDRQQPPSSADRQQPPSGVDRSYMSAGLTRFTSIDGNLDRQTTIKSVPPPELRPERGVRFGRIAVVAVASAALAALLVVVTMPFWQGTGSLFTSERHPQEAAKSEQRVSSNAPARDGERTNKASVDNRNGGVPAAKGDNSRIPVGKIAVAAAGGQPIGFAQAQQAPQPPQAPQAQLAAQHPVAKEPAHAYPPVRGVTDHEIRFGIAAPFSGAAKELGQHMKMGIETAFDAANASGGVSGRQLRLLAADDGYEPSRTAQAMKALYEKDQVFGVIGNVGTPTAAVSLPYALDHKMLFFGGFTGSSLLRSDPPDRYAFNYRASYAEETAAVVHYLVKVKRMRPEQIAVFAQQDAYGDAGFAGVAKAIRSLGGDDRKILRLNYTRNTVDVEDAVAQLQEHQKKARIQVTAVIMVPTYRAAARFIEKTRDLYPNMIYTSVSFVGSTALANELMLLGKKYATGVIVTQVVPPVDGHSSLALDYKSALAKYFPGEAPDYVSFEGYVSANILISALKRNGPQLDADKLVTTLENLHGLDIGLGTPVNFGRSEHQAVHKVWGSQLDATGHYQPIDLE
jgi:ABC-type branched-subunit amino acid transport system substrate-binding protein